ncbi:MAG: phosphoribosyltransferase [Hyphomicrobiales bacterium]|nr:phosphoribosyltransferase [Hyphomicrobiales bacterium]
MFHDRSMAGQQLAHELEKLLKETPGLTDPVVLALPRGGLPVGFEVARALHAPLDLLLVRKIGVPFQPELAAGAVVDGDHPELVINREVLVVTGMREADLQTIKARALAEIERRRSLYLKGRKRAPVAGRTAIVVDDGIATGATVRAALKAVRRRNPKALILAVPVAPSDAAGALSNEVDHLVCLAKPEPFYAIGVHYADFRQVEDDEVVRILEEAARLIAADDMADKP